MNTVGAVRGLAKGYGALNEESPAPCNGVHGAADLVFISQFKGCMNALGASLVGEVTGYMGGGSPPNGPYGVNAEVGANPVMVECSMIGTSRSWLWWLGVMLDTKVRVRLLPSCLD